MASSPNAPTSAPSAPPPPSGGLDKAAVEKLIADGVKKEIQAAVGPEMKKVLEEMKKANTLPTAPGTPDTSLPFYHQPLGPKISRLNPMPMLGTDGEERFKNTGGLIAGSTLAAGAAFGSSIAAAPVLQNVPFLPQTANALHTGLAGVTNWLGLGTGGNAYYSALSGLPAWAGPLGVGLVGIPSALALVGYMKNKLLGRPDKGFFGSMWETIKTPAELVGGAIKGVGNGFGALGSTVRGIPSVVAKPFEWLGKGISKVWGGATSVTKSVYNTAVKPTWLGTGAAVAGGVFIAPYALGATIPWVVASYLGGNLLKRGFSSGSSSASTATK